MRSGYWRYFAVKSEILSVKAWKAGDGKKCNFINDDQEQIREICKRSRTDNCRYLNLDQRAWDGLQQALKKIRVESGAGS